MSNSPDKEYSKFATKKWYVIDSESKGNYPHEHPIKFLTNSLESIICDYSDAYILVTGNINVVGGNNNTKVAFKNCSPFRKCRIEINETFIDEADFINITMPMYNLIEYSDNYSDTSGSLWQFKRDEITNNADVSNDNAPSFKYKANLIGNTENNGTKNGVKIAVPLKYLSNFWRSLEMPLINCKVEFSLKWIENCVLTIAELGANADATDADGATFKITDAKLYVPVVTLSAEDNIELVKQLKEGFERPVHWNKYKLIDNKVVEIAAANAEKTYKRIAWFKLSRS